MSCLLETDFMKLKRELQLTLGGKTKIIRFGEAETEEELNKIFNNKFRINKVHIGSSIISTIITYIEIFTSRLLNKIYFENFFINLKNIDYDVNYGTFGDNIIIKAIKIK